MTKKSGKTLLVLAASGLLASGLFVSAQGTQPGAQREGISARRAGPSGMRALPLGRLALGTSVDVSFYDGDPEAGGQLTETLRFTYGEDSESAFAESFASTREDAAYLSVDIGEQTHTLDLSEMLERADGRRGQPRLPLGRGLNDGGTITATLYDGDPEAGAQTLQTFTFVQGQDSRAGFRDEVQAAAEDAAFMSVTTSPQSYTVDLSQFSGHGPGFGRRGNR